MSPALFFDFGVCTLVLVFKRWIYGKFLCKNLDWFFLVTFGFFWLFFLTAAGAFLATVFVKQGMFGIFWFFL